MQKYIRLGKLKANFLQNQVKTAHGPLGTIENNRFLLRM